MKRILLCILVTISVLLLCSCQNSPTSQIVTNKRTGDSQTYIKGANSQDNSADLEYEDFFYSTDGTVEFRFNIEEMPVVDSTPTYEVVPHYLTETDVKRTANALFPDADFIEAPPEFDTVYSKEEIRKRLERWAPYTNNDAVYELYGEDRDTSEIVKKFIQEYSEMFETAPDERLNEPCQWTFKKESFYYDAAEKISESDTSKDDDMIQANVGFNGVEYTFQAKMRNKTDYKLNYLSAFLDSGISPDGIDKRIFSAKLCRTEKPTEEQIALVKEKAEHILTEIALGDWEVDECYLKTDYFGDTPEYTVCVNAVPVLDGIAAARCPQLDTYGNANDTYAANYFFTEARFEFSGNGELVRFRMYSPIDIYKVVNDNTKVLSNAELLAKAQKLLALSDYYQYDKSFVIDFANEAIGCTVDICKCVYQLSRIKVPNTDDHYYYVPSLQIQGNIQVFGKTSGDIYYASDAPETLLTLNAVDGSVINATNQ